MAREDLAEYLLPLCAGLMHPKIWEFCKKTSGGAMRWADTRQRAYYLMMRFVKLMHLMWGLRCRYVHSHDPTSVAGQHRDRFLRATRLAKLELNNPDLYDAELNGKWWPVVVTESLRGFSYNVQVLDRCRTEFFDVPQVNIRTAQRSANASPTKETVHSKEQDKDELMATVEHELEAAALAKSTDDTRDEDYHILECCGICLKRGRPERYCPDCTVQYCLECGNEENCVECLQKEAEEEKDINIDDQEE
jgi:hypothetical protein